MHIQNQNTARNSYSALTRANDSTDKSANDSAVSSEYCAANCTKEPTRQLLGQD